MYLDLNLVELDRVVRVLGGQPVLPLSELVDVFLVLELLYLVFIERICGHVDVGGPVRCTSIAAGVLSVQVEGSKVASDDHFWVVLRPDLQQLA